MASTLALIALGSNLGDRSGTLDRAIAEVAAVPGLIVRGVSSYHETAPIGGPGGQGPFLNAGVALETSLDAFALHRVLIEVEARAGRVRDTRWGARTLDLDLILFGSEIIDTPELIVPHPRFPVRRFVLAPLSEVAPKAIDPLTRRSIASLLANLDRRPSYVALDGASPGVWTRVVAGLSAAGFAWCNRMPGDFEACPGPGRTPASAGDAAMLLHDASRELLRARWASDLWDDRWIVTDLWFDRLIHLPDRMADLDRNAFRASFLRSRSSTIPPTFVVAAGQSAPDSTALDPEEPLRQWADRVADSYPIGSEAPILRLRASETGRFRDRWSEARQEGNAALATELERAWDDAIAAQILAACDSARAGIGGH